MPSIDREADVIVIGTGQAGVPLAARLAAAGKRVVVIERAAPGGTCVNYGCTPTKTMIASARAAHVARTAGRLGVRAGAVEVDFAAIVARKDAMVSRWRQGVEKRLAAAGDKLEFLHGHARFVGPRTIAVGGRSLRAERVVINVGARAAVPELPGLADAGALDSAGALELRELPRHLVVLGGGYIGCELGQMFRRFGSSVTIVSTSARILPREDEDVSESVESALRSEGITLMLEQRVDGVRRAGADITLTLAQSGQHSRDDARSSASDVEPDAARQLLASHLLVATGRRPNTDDLGCEAGGIAIDSAGFIEVDERYETRSPGVFAVGDCIPGPQFTHVAWDDHRVLFDILTDRPARQHTDRLVPYTVFTDPQVAGVGLSERDAAQRGMNVDVARLKFGSIARAIETDETAGLVKVLVDPSSEKVLGARIVGVDAGELIHVFSVLMEAGGSVRAVIDAEFVHPTFAEGLQTAIMTLPRYALA